jgi:DNA (cytosine-5)-methyltransferase 1
MTLTVGSLFTGIGGIDLGLERAGMRVVWQAEIDPYCCRVLARHWPTVPNLGDVTTINWEDTPRVDLICGGYPCQPFSTAGRMAGADDPRHLWPHFADALSVLRPRYAVLENVPAHLGVGFDIVLGDLARLGFDAEWSVVPAAAVGAPQRRPRLFVVAHREGTERFGRRWLSAVTGGGRYHGQVADTHRCRTHVSGPGDAGPWTTEPAVVRLVDGVPDPLVRPALYALGNAVVPQVAEHIGRLILAAIREAA